MRPERILEPGRNVWRLERAHRASVIIDAAAYYDLLVDALEKAERSILILGWDLDSRLRLRLTPGFPTLKELLEGLVRAKRQLHIDILSWDPAMVYAFERDVLPVLKLDWTTHRRLRFRLDDHHPPGASHHEKVVVVDDRLAFVGGLDLAASRWDTPEHPAHDPRRVNPQGNTYPPFHDLMMAVDGDAARALGDLARERWYLTSGRRLRRPETRSDPWPERLEVQVRDVDVGIARTRAPFDGRPGVQEVARLYQDAIAASEHAIYVENQFFSAIAVEEALSARLGREDPPEVVVVQPREAQGWLESATMGLMRARMIERLKAANRKGRVGIYSAYLEELEQGWLHVHSKVMLVDDGFLTLGSANVANRSMSLDTECNLAIEARGDAGIAAFIARVRDRLLAEHLGVPVEQVGAQHHQGVLETIRALEGGRRTLRAFQPDVSEWLDASVPEGLILDPEQTIDPDALFDLLVPEGVLRSGGRPVLKGALVGLGTAALLGLWRSGRLGERLDALPLIRRVQRGGVGAAAVAFGAGSLVPVPFTLQLLAGGFLLGAGRATSAAAAGAGAGTVLGWGLGRLLGRSRVRRIGGGELNRVARRLGRGGVREIAQARLAPIAPFPAVNLLAGASRVPLLPLLAGTLLGAAPRLLILPAFGHALRRVLRAPTWGGVGLLALSASVLSASALQARRLLERKRSGERRKQQREPGVDVSVGEAEDGRELRA